MVLRGATNRKIGKTLIINSDQEITRILEINLTHANLEVISAKNGASALKILQNNKPDIIILDTALPDMDCVEIYNQLKDLTVDIPVILIGSTAKRKYSAFKHDDIVLSYIDKPFEPKEVVALVKGYLMHKERATNIDPLTGLPNRIQVYQEIDGLIAEKSTFAFIYLTLHDFHGINQYYGYDQGDIIIHLLSEIISQAVRLFGNPEDLTGHFSKDKFAIISTPWKARILCRRIIADYNRRVKSMFSEEHLQTGHIPLGSPMGHKARTPVMSIHIAVVTNQKRSFRHHLEVIGCASEQIEYLKNSSDSDSYFDFRINGTGPSLTTGYHGVTRANQEEPGIIQGILTWLDFLHREMEHPIQKLKENLVSLSSCKAESFTAEQRKYIRLMQSTYLNLTQVMEVIDNIARPEGFQSNSVIDEVDVRYIIDWVMEQVQALAEEKDITANIKASGDVFRILIDKKCLTQCLLYIMRNEIRSSQAESIIQIELLNKNRNEENVYIIISNPGHYLSPRALNVLVHGQTDIMRPETLMNEIYPARVLLKGMGGKLEVYSTKESGIVYHITLPKKWQSSMTEVNTLQSAIDITRKDTREVINKLQHKIASIVNPLPSGLEETYEKLSGKVQELAILSNRSLFLADDCNSRLEMQQDRLSNQESEQLATIEALNIICREMLGSIQVNYLFDIESNKRVAEYALAIANELKMPESDRRALNQAALLKDIAYTFSKPEIIEPMVSSPEMVSPVKKHFYHVWKAISSIPFFLPACNLLLYKFEKFDGSGGNFGIKGADIPLGSGILAVADAFDSMTSDRAGQDRLTLKQAMKNLAEDSGSSFDPKIVNAFLTTCKKKGFHNILKETAK